MSVLQMKVMFVVLLAFNPIALIMFGAQHGVDLIYYVNVLGTGMLGWLLHRLRDGL